MVYDDLVDLEDVIFATTHHTSLRDTTLAGSSGASTTHDALGIDALTVGATV